MAKATGRTATLKLEARARAPRQRRNRDHDSTGSINSLDSISEEEEIQFSPDEAHDSTISYRVDVDPNAPLSDPRMDALFNDAPDPDVDQFGTARQPSRIPSRLIVNPANSSTATATTAELHHIATMNRSSTTAIPARESHSPLTLYPNCPTCEGRVEPRHRSQQCVICDMDHHEHCGNLYELQGATLEEYPEIAPVCTRCRKEPAPVEDGQGTGYNRFQEAINQACGLPDDEDGKWGLVGEDPDEDVNENGAPLTSVTTIDGSSEEEGEEKEGKGASLAVMTETIVTDGKSSPPFAKRGETPPLDSTATNSPTPTTPQSDAHREYTALMEELHLRVGTARASDFKQREWDIVNRLAVLQEAISKGMSQPTASPTIGAETRGKVEPIIEGVRDGRGPCKESSGESVAKGTGGGRDGMQTTSTRSSGRGGSGSTKPSGGNGNTGSVAGPNVSHNNTSKERGRVNGGKKTASRRDGGGRGRRKKNSATTLSPSITTYFPLKPPPDCRPSTPPPSLHPSRRSTPTKEPTRHHPRSSHTTPVPHPHQQPTQQGLKSSSPHLKPHKRIHFQSPPGTQRLKSDQTRPSNGDHFQSDTPSHRGQTVSPPPSRNGYYAVLMDNEDQAAPSASNAPFPPVNEIQQRHSNNNTDIDSGHLHHNDEAEAGRHHNDDSRTDGRAGGDDNSLKDSGSDNGGLAGGAGSGSPVVSDDGSSDDENKSTAGGSNGSQGSQGQTWATYNSPVNDGWESPSNFNREPYLEVREHADGEIVDSSPGGSNATSSPNGSTYSPSNESDEDGGGAISDQGSTGSRTEENADSGESVDSVLSVGNDNSSSDESEEKRYPEGSDKRGGTDDIGAKYNTGGAGQETSGGSSGEESPEGSSTSSGAESEEGGPSGGNSESGDDGITEEDGNSCSGTESGDSSSGEESTEEQGNVVQRSFDWNETDDEADNEGDEESDECASLSPQGGGLKEKGHHVKPPVCKPTPVEPLGPLVGVGSDTSSQPSVFSSAPSPGMEQADPALMIGEPLVSTTISTPPNDRTTRSTQYITPRLSQS